MAAAPGFLEFFILEASDYIEQLDGLLLGGSTSGPDGDALQRAARALRGTATMAKLPAFAELAGGVERVGRAIHEHALAWEPAVSGALTSAIDELKTLLHSARNWSDVEDRRARERATELARFAPARLSPTSGGHVTVSGTPSSFLATEAANIAAGLELLTARGGDPETAANVLRRARALRGVAGVKEIAPLSESLEAIEDAGRGLETARDQFSPERSRLLAAAAGYLRAISAAMRAGGDVSAQSGERDEFEAARTAVDSAGDDRDRIVPIGNLFYEDGNGVVDASRHPPTTAPERFRLELVSLGEHLRQVIVAARAAEASGAVRARRDVSRALKALQSAADSFGEREVAQFIRSHTPAESAMDARALSELDDLAAVIAEPGSQGERLRARLQSLGSDKHGAVPSAPSAPSAPFAAKTPPPRAAASASALLDSSISALEAYSSTPSAPRTALPEESGEVVPIESLLYRGRAALDRAVQLRDTMRQAGANPHPDALDELYDLLELARSE